MEQFTGLVLVQNEAGRTAIRLDGEGSKVTVGVNAPGPPDDPIGEPVPGPRSATSEDPLLTDRISIDGATGSLSVNSDDGSPLVTVGAAGNAGDVVVRDRSGREVLHLNGGRAELLLGSAGNEGSLVVLDAGEREVLKFTGGDGVFSIGADDQEGHLIVRDADGTDVLVVDGADAQLFVGASGNEGDVIVRDEFGHDTIHLNGSSGDIILANSDAAEDFELAAAAEATPGAVMVLTGAGTVRPCAAAYDRKVVGVVAGAGSFRPGIVLGRRPGHGRVPISVLGKAACQASAAYGAIEVGDLLTSSPTTGTAMRVSDSPQAFGAVIGKALTPLPAGVGLVEMVIGLR